MFINYDKQNILSNYDLYLKQEPGTNSDFLFIELLGGMIRKILLKFPLKKGMMEISLVLLFKIEYKE